MLATDRPMGLEPPPGAGASGGTNAAAHHRVCPCHSGASRASCCLTCAYIWLCSPHSRHPPRKTGRFTGADFPLQPDGTLRCPAGQSLSAQEQRRARRWEPAHCVCGQHSQLPPLSVARAVPMEWRGNGKAAPGECAFASSSRRRSATAASRDWSRREHRRACRELVRHQRIEVNAVSYTHLTLPTNREV